jgi:hypothetical protein
MKAVGQCQRSQPGSTLTNLSQRARGAARNE